MWFQEYWKCRRCGGFNQNSKVWAWKSALQCVLGKPLLNSDKIIKLHRARTNIRWGMFSVKQNKNYFSKTFINILSTINQEEVGFLYCALPDDFLSCVSFIWWPNRLGGTERNISFHFGAFLGFTTCGGSSRLNAKRAISFLFFWVPQSGLLGWLMVQKFGGSSKRRTRILVSDGVGGRRSEETDSILGGWRRRSREGGIARQ